MGLVITGPIAAVGVTLTSDAETFLTLVRSIRRHAEELRNKGVEEVPLIGNTTCPHLVRREVCSICTPRRDPWDFLPVIRQDLGDCSRCGLCQQRTNIVFGEGPERAQVAFVGEAPGADEDLTGKPFQGQAGQLLDKMLEAMQREAYRQWRDPNKPGIDFGALLKDRAGVFKRENVYIANVLKCRPPLNRKPDPEEIQQCLPFLERQLQALPNLKVIVTLGVTSAQALLWPFTKLAGGLKALRDIRGRWQEWRGIPLMPTWHPAYLLRDPSHKGEAWEDLKLVIERMK
jgi:DNA polymerase